MKYLCVLLFWIMVLMWNLREGYPTTSSYTLSTIVPEKYIRYLNTKHPYVVYTRKPVHKKVEEMYYKGLTPSLVISTPSSLKTFQEKMVMNHPLSEEVTYVYSKDQKKYVEYTPSVLTSPVKSCPVKICPKEEPSAPFF